jgi:excinuclease UvrABC ATPase subunit
MTDARWLATINHITDAGVLPVEHDIEALGEIEWIVELGPDWNTIETIVIRCKAGPLRQCRKGERALAGAGDS